MAKPNPARTFLHAMYFLVAARVSNTSGFVPSHSNVGDGPSQNFDHRNCIAHSLVDGFLSELSILRSSM